MVSSNVIVPCGCFFLCKLMKVLPFIIPFALISAYDFGNKNVYDAASLYFNPIYVLYYLISLCPLHQLTYSNLLTCPLLTCPYLLSYFTYYPYLLISPYYLSSVSNGLSCLPFVFFDVSAFILLPLFSLIKVIVFSFDVIHSFSLYSLGFKIDAIPGRLNSLNIRPLMKGEIRG